MTYEFASYLEDAGFGTLGTDIFVDQLPDSTNGIGVFSISGEMGYYVPMDTAILEVYSKDTSAQEAITKLKNIRDFVHRMHSTETTNSVIYSILVIGDVEVVERDQQYAKIFKLTVQVINRNKSIIS